MAKFVDTFEGVVSLKTNVAKSRNALASIGVQSKPLTIQCNDTQTDIGSAVACQTKDLRADISNRTADQDPNFNWHTLNDFLLRAEPMILRAIADNRRTARLFAIYDSATSADEREAHVILEHTLKSDSNWPEGAQTSTVAWNSSGTTVGVSGGRMMHEDWCTHRGCVMTWNVDRGRLNPNKADHVYETVSCCTGLAFHPNLPNLFVCCTYTGDLLVWSLSDEGDPIATAQTGDQSSINCVAWLPSTAAAGDTMQFASGGADGRVLIWTIPSKGRILTLSQAFQLTVANLPRTVRGKVGGENKATGIGTLSFARPPLVSRFIIGTETGGVFQCSTEVGSASAIGNRVNIAGMETPVQCYDPVALTQKPHNGPAYKTQFHPRQPTVIATCGADGYVRIGAAFQTVSNLDVDTNAGNLYDLSWSLLRPCVFACATSGGKLLVFDLTQATDRPILNIDATSSDQRGSLLAVAFNPRRAHVLATGDSAGYVKVWNLGEAFSNAQIGEEKVLEDLVASAASEGAGENEIK